MGKVSGMRRARKILDLRVRDGDACWLCGEVMIFEPGVGKNQQVTIDHVVPWSQGGGNHIDNLKLACYKCNIHRGNGMVGRVKYRKKLMLGEYACVACKLYFSIAGHACENVREVLPCNTKIASNKPRRLGRIQSNKKPHMIQRLRSRDGDACSLCGQDMDFSCKTQPPVGHAASIEHIKCMEVGGTHDFDNLRLACVECNRYKGNGFSGRKDNFHKLLGQYACLACRKHFVMPGHACTLQEITYKQHWSNNTGQTTGVHHEDISSIFRRMEHICTAYTLAHGCMDELGLALVAKSHCQ